MQRTELEPVTRTYCDVCGKDITHSTIHVVREGDSEEHRCSAHNRLAFGTAAGAHAADQTEAQSPRGSGAAG